MISIHGLSKRFGSVDALKGIDATIADGTITAIVGPNGSGKSTLIKTILGLVKADKGRLEMDGSILNGQSGYRRLIGYMPQMGHFPENLRVIDVMRLVRSVRGEREIQDYDLAQRLGLDRDLNKRINTLSGGTRQKLNAVIAFMFPSRLYILDEPTVGLDPVSSGIVKAEIRRKKQQGKTILLTSHIMSEVEELAETIIFLSDGSVYYAGTISDVKKKTGTERLEEALAVLMKEENHQCR